MRPSIDQNQNQNQPVNWKHYSKMALAFAITIGGYLGWKLVGWGSTIWSEEDGNEEAVENAHQLVTRNQTDLNIVPLESYPYMGRKLLTTNEMEFEVSDSGAFYSNEHYSPVAAGISSSDFVIAWSRQQSSNALIYGQRFDANGDKLGSLFSIGITMYYGNRNPAISSLPGGGFVATWTENDGFNAGILGQVYDSQANRVGITEFHANTFDWNEDSSAIAALPDGKFVATWWTYGDSSYLLPFGQEIRCQRFDGLGNKLGSEINVNNYTAGDQFSPGIAALSYGDFMVVWHSENQDGNGYGIYGQRLDSEGNKLGGEMLINTYTVGNQVYPVIISLPSDEYIIEWQSNTQDGSGYGIYGQRLDANGNKIGSEFRVTTYTINDQSQPASAPLSLGGFVSVWQSYAQGSNVQNGIYGQRFDDNANKIGKEFQITTNTLKNQIAPSVAALPQGKFVVTWNRDNGYDPFHEWRVYARIYNSIFLDNNQLTIFEGQIVAINNTVLSASSFPYAPIRFNITNVQQGRFESSNIPGQVLTTFTQQQVDDGVVYFLHDGSELPPNYQVTVSDGISAIGPCLPTITFTNVNDGPTLGNNTLTVYEGQTVALTSNNLSATDPDNTATQLTFAVSDVQRGQFELVSNPGIPITSFTQQQINNNRVRFVHMGGEDAPGYRVSVSDGQATTAIQTATIIFIQNPIYDPILVQNQLIIQEGKMVLLTPAMLQATDLNNTPAQLVFTISDILHGYFELVNNPGVAIESFTQQQIDDGQIRFVHDGGENAPSYRVSVSDGRVSTPLQLANILFTPSNDAPVLNGGGILSYTENAGAIAVDENIIITDVDSTQLRNATVTIANNFVPIEDRLGFVNQNGIVGTYFPTAGTLNLNGLSTAANYRTALRNVTYENLSDNPSTDPRTITFQLMDDGNLHSNVVSRTLIINPVNDAPEVSRPIPNQSIQRGGSYGYTFPSNTFIDIEGDDLSYTVALSNNNPWPNWLGFDGPTRFFAGDPPSASGRQTYSIRVNASDGHGGNIADIFSLTINNQEPILANPFGPQQAYEGVFYQRVVPIDTFTDDDNDPLIYTANLVGGSPLVGGIHFTSVTRTFAGTPLYTDLGIQNIELIAEDGFGGQGKTTFSLTTSPSLVLVNNQWNIREGERLIVTSNMLSATDVDGPEESLIFTVSNVQHGQFELSTTVAAVASFAQQQIANGVVRFVHDGGEEPPRFSLQVSDGSTSSDLVAANIQFIPVNDAPMLGSNSNHAITYNKGSGIVVIDPVLEITDNDSTFLDGADVRITTNFDASQDLLGITNQRGITGTYQTSSGTLTLIGRATLADYQVALRTVTYQNVADEPRTAIRTIAFTVNDGMSRSNELTRQISFVSPKTASFTENVIEKIAIALPSTIGGLGLGVFGIWAYRRQVDKSWVEHPQYYFHDYLRKALKLDVGTVSEARNKGYINVLFQLLGKVLRIPRLLERRQSDAGEVYVYEQDNEYYRRIGESVKEMSEADKKNYAQVIFDAIKTHVYFSKLCGRDQDSKKIAFARTRYFKECCPNPTSLFVSYKFEIERFEKVLDVITEAACSSLSLNNQTRSLEEGEEEVGMKQVAANS